MSYKNNILKTVVRLVGITLLTIVIYRAGLALTFNPENFIIFWPLSGFALALLLIYNRKEWFGIILAVFTGNALGNLVSGKDVWVNLFSLISDSAIICFSAFFTALALKKYYKKPVRFTSVKELIVFIILAVFLINAVVSALGAFLNNLDSLRSFLPAWGSWFISDGIGILLVTPIVILWFTQWQKIIKSFSVQNIFEFIIILILILAFLSLNFRVFNNNIVLPLYLIFPFLLWIAFRYNQVFVLSVILLLSVYFVFQSRAGYLPFNSFANYPIGRVRGAQVFLFISVLSTFTLSLAINEKNLIQKGLQQYKHIVSVTPDLMALLNSQYIYQAVNNAYGKAFKMAPSEITGKTPGKLFGKDFFNKSIKPYAERALAGEVVRYKNWIKFPALGNQYMEVTYLPFFDESGKIDGFVVNARDITRQHQAEKVQREQESKLKKEQQKRLKEAKTARLSLLSILEDQKDTENQLRQSEEKFKGLANSITDVFFALDKNLNYTFWNIGCERLTGIKFEDAIGKSYFEMEINKGFEWIADIYNEVISSGKSQSFEVDFKDEPEKIFFSVTAYPALNGIAVYSKDITEFKKLQKELEELNYELTRLNRHIQDAQEIERKNLSREIHDDLGQSLTALKLDLVSLKNLISLESDDIKIRLASAIELADQTIKTTQDLTSELRPGLIDDLGILPAIEWYTDEFSRRSNISVKLDLNIDDNDIPEANKIHIYRIVQESLTNIARHAKAKSVLISLEKTKKQVKLLVSDDGIGINQKEITNHDSFGLIGMRERAQAINGEINISGVKNKGTTISLTLNLT